jgi:aspartyl/glutamyl-tRNA(Asn/Gln) amidotransferase C subunit
MEKQEFYKLLKTARIELEDEELDPIEKDIEDILDFFNRIESVPLDADNMAFHSVDIPGKLRQDKEDGKDDIDNVFYNSESYRFYFLGPKV